MIDPQDRIPVTIETAHRDYILTDYSPLVDPMGRLQPVSLLRHGLRGAGWLEQVWPVCEALRAAVGPDRTVWALKYGADDIGLEFYFYNNQANNPPGPLSIRPIARALKPFGVFPQLCEERLPYFMWSFELTQKGLSHGRFEPIRLYMGTNEEQRTECGFSYRLEDGGAVLENHYAFYQPKTELADVQQRLARSPRTGRPQVWRSLLPQQLTECYTICYAVKPQRDGLYFARISSAQLAWFLRRVSKPALADVMEAHKEDFAHCVWDLGYDFALDESAIRPRIEKVAIHGVF